MEEDSRGGRDFEIDFLLRTGVEQRRHLFAERRLGNWNGGRGAINVFSRGVLFSIKVPD